MKPGPAATGAGSYPRIYAVVRRIPSGRVATYGQVGRWRAWPGAHARSATPCTPCPKATRCRGTG